METKKLLGDPPNGKWGWMVVLGSFVIKIFNQALVFIFGFLYGSRFAELNFTQSEISLIMNLSNVFTNLSGWVIGLAMEYFSVRQVAVFGCMMISFGIMLSSIATTLTHFVVTYGLMVGTGLGLIGSSSFLAVCSFFTTRKNRAVSLAMAGTGLGQMMLPQVVNLFMPIYGSSGTILIVGGLSLNGLIGALFFQPLEWHLVNAGGNKSAVGTSPLLEAQESGNSESSKKKSFKSQMMTVVDFTLIKDLRFMVLSVGLSCGFVIIMDLLMVLPFFLQVSVERLQISNILTL